jgi:hypothetical protein
LCGCAAAIPDAVMAALSKVDRSLLADIYQNGAGTVNDTLLQRYAGGYDKAVASIFGQGEVDELQRNLRINASRWGTCKTFELSGKLEELRRLPRKEFDEKAGKLVERYNRYQAAECAALLNRARSARQFESFLADADLYPNIEWLASRSVTAREEHQAYTGLVLPVGDPFWDNNQPGNEYGCKCGWRNTDRPVTGKPAQTSAPATGMEGNPAKTGELVTGRHPYFARNTGAPKWMEDKAVLRLPDGVVYRKVTTPAGNSFHEHLLLKAGEAEGNREIAGLLADNGYKDIRLLPQIYKTETALRDRYYGKDFNAQHPAACPDARIRNVNIEFKKCNRRNLSLHILASAEKSNITVVKLTEPMSPAQIERFINGQWEMDDRKNLDRIILITDGYGNLRSFKRP